MIHSKNKSYKLCFVVKKMFNLDEEYEYELGNKEFLHGKKCRFLYI